MASRVDTADHSDWGCDICGRDAAQARRDPARIYEGRRAGADRDFGDSGVSVAQRAGRDDDGGGE